jgi:hypothetical protein
MRTSFHHQPEAQHPNSSAIHKLAGRLPYLLARMRHSKIADGVRFRGKNGRAADITGMRVCPQSIIRKHSRDLPMGITDRAMEAWYHSSIA